MMVTALRSSALVRQRATGFNQKESKIRGRWHLAKLTEQQDDLAAVVRRVIRYVLHELLKREVLSFNRELARDIRVGQCGRKRRAPFLYGRPNLTETFNLAHAS
jgi:hypothetical protein